MITTRVGTNHSSLEDTCVIAEFKMLEGRNLGQVLYKLWPWNNQLQYKNSSISESIITVTCTSIISFNHRKGFLHVSVQLGGKDLVEWWFSLKSTNAVKDKIDSIDELLSLLTWVVEDIEISVVHKLSTHYKTRQNIKTLCTANKPDLCIPHINSQYLLEAAI